MKTELKAGDVVYEVQTGPGDGVYISGPFTLGQPHKTTGNFRIASERNGVRHYSANGWRRGGPTWGPHTTIYREDDPQLVRFRQQAELVACRVDLDALARSSKSNFPMVTAPPADVAEMLARFRALLVELNVLSHNMHEANKRHQEAERKAHDARRAAEDLL